MPGPKDQEARTEREEEREGEVRMQGKGMHERSGMSVSHSFTYYSTMQRNVCY